tara:strand:+ start:21966 stop:22577 length:612 start_codon:yes stop_codon:yes gene_type:complete
MIILLIKNFLQGLNFHKTTDIGLSLAVDKFVLRLIISLKIYIKMETKIQQMIISQEQLLKHWQGHRGLTRRVIETFPEEQLFNFTIGEMRPFGEMVQELLGIAGPGIKGLVTRKWEPLKEEFAVENSKKRLLELWDQATVEIDEWFPKLTTDEFQETVLAFGQYENKIYCTLMYFIDNEIHHRGQGYVYLRALGLEPPYFWEH